MKPYLLVSCLALAACHHDSTSGSDLAMPFDFSTSALDLASRVDAAADLAQPVVTACAHATPRPDDATRALVISHPYSDPNGDGSPDFELLQVDSTGTITSSNKHFSLGRTPEGTIVFTPDGSIGLVAEDDGTIGVFAVADGATPEVVEASHKSSVYATALVMTPMGDHVLALSAQTTANGGGVYSFPIGCDGHLGAPTLVTAADLPYAFLPMSATTAAMYARSLPNAPTGDNAHVVTTSPAFAQVASTTAFGTNNDKAIIYGNALTHDGKYLLLGDDDQIDSTGNRLAVLAVSSTTIASKQEIASVNDPFSIVTSPYDNAAIVVSGFGNAIFKLTYDPTNTTTPFANTGAITYVGTAPQIPGGAVMVKRGMLNGHVFIAENEGIRPVRFETTGAVTDLGIYSTATTGYVGIVGCIGIQP